MPKKEHKKTERKKSVVKKGKKKVSPADLLPESRDFLEKEEPVLTEIRTVKAVKPKEEFHKKMIMWTGITFFMVLILTIWLSNTKQVFEETAASKSQDKELGEIFGELNSAITELKSGFEELGNLQIEPNKIENNLPSNLEEDMIEELKMKLEENRSEVTE